MAYGSALAAPAIIGGVAEVTSLPAAMSVMTALLVVVPLGARALRTAGNLTDGSGRTAAPGEAHPF